MKSKDQLLLEEAYQGTKVKSPRNNLRVMSASEASEKEAEEFKNKYQILRQALIEMVMVDPSERPYNTVNWYKNLAKNSLVEASDSK